MLGYWNNPATTAETLKNGWLHTGDMGYFDNEGYLYVMGRFKSLLIGNDGEKYSPEGIEEAIIDQSPFIQQAILHNNQNPYTVGMFVPEIESVNRELKVRGIEKGTEEGNKESLKIILNEVNEYKKGGEYEGIFPERWLPASIVILPEGFTQENGLVNGSMKIVRGKITEYFSKELEFLYTPQAKNIENAMNIEAIKKWNT